MKSLFGLKKECNFVGRKQKLSIFNRRNKMKVRLNTKFLATEGVPELLTVGMIPFTMLAYFCDWVHGGVETTMCAGVCLLCIWSTCYREYQNVQDRISKLHFAVFCAAFLSVFAIVTKLYAMTEATSTQKLFFVAIAVVPCLIVCASYNNAVHKAEKCEEKDKERRKTLAGYKALWTVAIFLLAYSACFWAVYFWGDTLGDLLGMSRLSVWQVAMHNILN